jgi:hypothetical protein
LLAELALALAGFTGVAGAFGGRDRSYSSGDLIRMESIFLSAGSVLLGTLCALTLCGAGFSDAVAYEWSSLVAASMLSPFFFRLTPRAIKLAADTAATTSSSVVALGSVQTLASVSILVGNFIAWGAAWPLLTASTLQIAWGLFLFARIMTHRN